MKFKKLLSGFLSLSVIAACMAFPLTALAEGRPQPDYDRARYIVRLKNNFGPSIGNSIVTGINFSPKGIVKANFLEDVCYRLSQYTKNQPHLIFIPQSEDKTEIQFAMQNGATVPNGGAIVDCLYQSAYSGAPLSYQQNGQTVYQTFTPPAGYSLIDVMVGDVDGNGIINNADSELIQKKLAGLVVLNEKQSLAADVNFDGVVNTSDSLEVLKYINNGYWSNSFPDVDDFFNTTPVA